jgi:hypothetical protein
VQPYRPVRKVRTRYKESVQSGQRDGSVKRTICGSKEVACEASRCAVDASVSFGGDGEVGAGATAGDSNSAKEE